jgi:hypothetical protein
MPREYAQADLEPLSKQVASGSGWSRVIHVKDEEESPEIYMDRDGGRPAGLPIIAAEPDELEVIDTRGAAPLARFEELVRSKHTVRPQESNRQQRRAYHALTSGFSAR